MSKKQPPPATSGGFGALADAFAKKGFDVPKAAAPAPVAAPAKAKAEKQVQPKPTVTPGKIVVRKESKGRGGKAATLIRGIDLTGAPLEALVKKLKTKLGTGATIDDDGAIAVQGEQIDRVIALLVAEGFQRVKAG